MTVELTCSLCHTRQPPWNLEDGDIGPCRYCGAPLPRPARPIRKGTYTETHITAIPFDQPADIGITATPEFADHDVPAFDLLKRPGWTESWGALAMVLGKPLLLLKYRSVLILLLMSSLAGIGFCCGVDEIAPGAWCWGFWGLVRDQDYEYRQWIEFLGGLSLVVGTVVGIKLRHFDVARSSRRSLGWLALILLVLVLFTISIPVGIAIAVVVGIKLLYFDVARERRRSLGWVVFVVVVLLLIALSIYSAAFKAGLMVGADLKPIYRVPKPGQGHITGFRL